MLGNVAHAVHVLFAVLWVGGMAFALIAVRPSLAAVERPAERLALMAGIHRRFFLVVWHAMPITLVTGYVLLFGHFGGFRGSAWHIHLMHLTALLMSGIYLAIFFGPWKRMRAALAAGDTAGATAANEAIGKLVTANLALGLVTVFVAAWGRMG